MRVLRTNDDHISARNVSYQIVIISSWLQPFPGDCGHGKNGRNNGKMGHKGSQSAEQDTKDPVPGCIAIAHQLCVVKISPVLHEDVAEGAVEHCVDQVGQAQVEDEQVGDRPHLVMACYGIGDP